MTASNALTRSTTRHAVMLEGLKTEEVNQFASTLKKIDRHLRLSLSGTDLTEFSRTRMEKQLKAVEKALSEIFSNYYDKLAGHLLPLADYEAEFEARNLDNAIAQDDVETVIPPPRQVRAAVLSTPLSVRGPDGGKLLEPFIKDWTKVEKKRITGAIRQGFFEGQTNAQIIQAIRGTRKNGYRDGILAITKRNAGAVVRTSVQHVASAARFETWQANSDLVVGYRWTSTLDGRTSKQCRSLDGAVFQFGKGPRPPIHINCRSTTVAALDSRFDSLKIGRKRASKDGPVDGNITYYEWLKGESPEFQDDVLGPTLGEVFRHGGLSAQRFAELNLDRNFRPITIREMREKEPQIFATADRGVKAEPVTASSFKRVHRLLEKQVPEHSDLGTLELRNRLAKGYKWEVATLSKETQKLFGAKTNKVWVSDDTLVKQIRNRKGQPITLESYQLVDGIISHSDDVVILNEKNVSFLKRDNGKWYQVIAKTTADKKEIYVVSLNKVRDSDYLRIVRRGKKKR